LICRFTSSPVSLLGAHQREDEIWEYDAGGWQNCTPGASIFLWRNLRRAFGDPTTVESSQK
jgi:hypothetical protein